MSSLTSLQEIIRRHLEVDPGLSLALLFQGPGTTRILEVSRTIPTLNKLLPCPFFKSMGEPFDFILIICSPQDYASIQSGALKLPPDWIDPISIPFPDEI